MFVLRNHCLGYKQTIFSLLLVRVIEYSVCFRMSVREFKVKVDEIYLTVIWLLLNIFYITAQAL